jgi:hypothetical protein
LLHASDRSRFSLNGCQPANSNTVYHPSGISRETDELERIERVRYTLFIVLALVFFIVFQLSSQSTLWAAAFAASAAWLASGWYVARASTRGLAWAILEAEAKRDGGSTSKRMVWAANLLPPFVALAGFSVWLSVA